MTISVVIPVYNEAERIESRLNELHKSGKFFEVIVVDGNSDDTTADIAKSHGTARVLSAPRGRAKQMNAGAAKATGDVLLFLHADVMLPANAAGLIQDTMSHSDVVGGAFRTWTIDDAGRSWLSPFLHFADIYSRFSKLPYGDQAIFVHRHIFHEINGFPDLPIMEDREFARRLRHHGKIQIVPARVRVSGRRFLDRPIYYCLLINLIPWLHRLKVSPETLARFYRNVR